jgi:virulence-associated protein VagC
MKVAEIVQSNGFQLVKLPADIHLERDTVAVRRQGDAIILEPVRMTTWPEGFFEQIQIDDPAFTRPQQGQNLR